MARGLEATSVVDSDVVSLYSADRRVAEGDDLTGTIAVEVGVRSLKIRRAIKAMLC